MSKQSAHQLGWYLWLALVAFSPASTKAAGAAWVMAIVWSFWLAGTTPVIEASTAGRRELYRATTVIFWCFAAAFVLRTIGQLYWEDSWAYRHFDVRMLLTAIALHILVRRINIQTKFRRELVTALALSCIPALIVSYRWIQELSIPTNIIPWAFGMSLFALVLASYKLSPEPLTEKKSLALNRIATAGSLLLLTAIVLAGVRGAYLAVIWVFCVLLFSFRQDISLKRLNSRRLWLSYAGIAVFLGILFISIPELHEIPKKRITTALNEINSFKEDQRGTSVGLRLHFLERGVESFAQHPLLGVGIEKRNQLVDQWSREAKFPFDEMEHTHNEYLNSVIDYGILGGGATLSYLLGILLAALIVRRVNVVLSLTLAGICFATFTTFFTNTNTLHNFTSVTLGLALIYSIILCTNHTLHSDTDQACRT